MYDHSYLGEGESDLKAELEAATEATNEDDRLRRPLVMLSVLSLYDLVALHSDGEDEKVDVALKWQPDPVDADPTKTSRSRRTGT